MSNIPTHKSRPRVSVIMAVYNGEKYIAESIRSILHQTMPDFELMIVDDGSRDETVNIIKRFNDKRIRLLINEVNRGSIFSRNRAVRESSAPYIAILDSDDIALPQRFEKEVQFLDAHPDFAVIGTATRVIDSNGKETKTVWRNTLTAEMIPPILLFQNYFANSSTMFRREALPEGDPYRPMDPADDYDLWLRLEKKWKMWNLPEVLTKYRVHGTNMSTIRSARKNEVIDQIVREALWSRLQIRPTSDEFQTLKANYIYNGEDILSFLSKRENWLIKMKNQNKITHYFDQNIFEKVLAERWLSTCSSNTRIGFSSWKIFWRSSLSKTLDSIQHLPLLIKFFVKCLFKKDTLSFRTLIRFDSYF